MYKSVVLVIVLTVVIALFADGRQYPQKKQKIWDRGNRQGQNRRIKSHRRYERLKQNDVKPRLASRWMARFCSTMIREDNIDRPIDNMTPGLQPINRAKQYLIVGHRQVPNMFDQVELKPESHDAKRKRMGHKKPRDHKRLPRRLVRRRMLCEFLQEHNCEVPENLVCPK